MPTDLNDAILEAANRLGVRSGPAIADDILPRAFPDTLGAAKREGAEAILRRGLVAHVAQALKGGVVEGQADLSSIDPSFGPFVKPLRNKAYFVPSREEYLPIAALIAEPATIQEAATSLRQHGADCIAEAVRLDRLFEAVTGTTPEPANDAAITDGLDVAV